MNVKIEMTDSQARMALGEVESKMASLKNCIVLAVERGVGMYSNTGLTGYVYASHLVQKVRDYEEVFRIVNGAILRANGTIKD